ncbi:MAG: thioredoxin domain-containing protein, partial [Armatimonadia bacterium]
GVREEGNYREEASGEDTGASILHVAVEMSAEERGRLEEARTLLLKAREARVRPGRDDKVLTDWNGLMIAALARGAQVLGEAEYLKAAERAAEFILARMSAGEGKLLHRYREGEAAVPGYVDDCSFLAWGLIELYEASFEGRHLRRALELTDYLLRAFWDEERGGFYFSSADHEELLVRQKETYDGAVPSGNSVAMLNLLRLARLTGRAEYEARAAELSRAFGAEVRRSPAAHAQLLCGVDFAVGPASEVLLVGEKLAEMVEAVRGRFLPNVVVLVKTEEVGELAPFVARYGAVDGRTTAYVCSGQTCSAPVVEVEELVRLLGGKG